jgi:MYXO-CTERM domain-containing protein
MLPEGGGVIEETSDCFRQYGPAMYWRSASAGSAGALKWTNAFQSASPSNWARWHLVPAAAGEYDLDIYAEPGYAVHRATRYTVAHAGVSHDLVVDLGGASGWVTVGTFAFDGGGAEHISVYDNSPTAVPSDQRIPADAVRLVPAGAAPEPDPGTDPEPDPEPEPDPGTDPEPEPDPTEPTPGPRTMDVTPSPGGDTPPPTDEPIPDAPAHHHFGITSGCSASSTTAPPPAILGTLALAALATLTRRRRR